jgi:hypothetical protein
MPGAKLLSLHHDQSPWRDLSNVLNNLVAPVANDHYQVLWFQSGRGFNYVSEQ